MIAGELEIHSVDELVTVLDVLELWDEMENSAVVCSHVCI